MIVVDDRLSLDVLAGQLPVDDVVATTWSFHYRLVRALLDDHITGALTTSATEEVRRIAAAPPPARLVVLDPRPLVARAAQAAIRDGLNALAAELVAPLHITARTCG